MSNFKGIKQVLFSEYSGKAQAEKIGYLWLVRNGEGSESFDIYFGSRKYGSNDLSVISKLQDAFGGFLSADGAFTFPTRVEFTSFDDESVNDFGDVLIALDTAVKANQDALANVYTKTEVEGLIDDVEALLNNYATGVTVTVGSSTYTGTLANNVVNVDLSTAFDAAGKVKDVTVDGTSVMNGTTAVIDLSGKADVSSVNAISGRVDALELIKHATDVKYDTNSKKINLYAGEEVLGEGFDAAPFLVDGMLKTVEFVKDAEGKNTTTLRFTFNADGEDKVIDVNFADYVDTYHADEATLTLDSTTNTFSFKSADAEKINVNQIPVGGTPLADVLLAKNVTAITAGNLQVVLESLFSQNLWAENPRRIVPTSLGVSMNNPSITFTPTATTVEVGTEISVSASAANASASASITYTGFTYGYSVAKDNTKDGDTPASVAITGTKNTDSNYKLTFTTNNGFGEKGLADASAQNISSVEGYDNKLIVEEGTNKVTVYATSPTFSATVPAQNAIYACSSLKKTDDDHVVAASSATTISGATVTKNSNDSVTGAYKFYIGTSTNKVTVSDDIKKLSKTAWSNGKNDVTLISSKIDYTANNYVVIAIPTGYTIKEAINSFNLDGMIFGSPEEVDYYLPNNTPIKYNVYNAFIGEPYGFNKIVIGK